MLEVAEITPRGPGAVSVVRFRGRGALAAVEQLCRRTLAPGVPHLVRLWSDGEDLDQALVAVFSAEEVEVCVHGSPAVVRLLLQQCARMPSGRDSATLEERARDRLALAPCDSAARILLDQAEGALRRALEGLRNLAPRARNAEIERLLARWTFAHRAIEPARVVIAGPVNAGKSTLFNVLVGRRRTIESDEPGTTRDVVCEQALLGAYPVWLFDTAGERRLDSSSAGALEIERAGQARARIARASADLVLWLEPAVNRAPSLPVKDPQTVPIATLADRLDARDAADVPNAISARADPAGARALVARLFRRRFDLPDEPWIPGAAMPFTAQIASEIAALREVVDAATFAQRVQRLLDGA